MEEEINLLDYWRIIIKWKRTIYLVVGFITFLSVIISLLLPKTYRAEATLMPIGGPKGGGMASTLSQMGLGGLLAGVVGESSSGAQLLALLKSRTLAEKIIERYGLMKVFYSKKWDQEHQQWKGDRPPVMEDAVKKLFAKFTFVEDKKNQIIVIRGEMRDPKLVASVVNGYLEELAAHIHENTFTTAKRNRIFIEGQLERNKAELLESGRELSAFYENNKISNVNPTVDVDVSLGREELKKENSEVLATQDAEEPSTNSGLDAIPNAYAEVRKKTEEIQNKVNVIQDQIQKTKTVKEVPQQVYLQYLTLQRQLLGQVNALLTQQYEMAKIDEAKEDLNFQVIDLARVPVGRYKPQRTQIVIVSFIMALFSAVFYVFFRESLEKMKSLEKDHQV